MPGERWTIKETESLIDQVVGKKKLPELCIPGKSDAALQKRLTLAAEDWRLG